MYEFLRGPLVWIAFAALLAGAIYKIWRLYKLADKEVQVLPYMSWRPALRSLLHWVVPFASRNMRQRPAMTIVAFVFHFCLLATPLLLMAHNALWFESWGVRLPSLPDCLADIMTLAVIAAGFFFAARRVTDPVVEYVSFASDWLLLAIAIGPFVTGFIAAHGWFPYEAMLALHIITGVVWLAAIPFSRLTHALYFVFTRAYLGSDMQGVRGSRDW